jgi:cytoskeletal protein CcmA (bactofilin family)
MLEVKRKSADSGVAKSATGLATSRAIKSTPTKTASVATPPVRVTPYGSVQGHQTRPPVLVGEAHFTGNLPVDGILLGQLGGGNGSLNVRQRSRASAGQEPELAGEINFRDMVRVNGYIAGSVYSETGTLIVDTNARVDANVEVGVAVISGCVNGDIVAREKVEIGPNAKIHGNIWTKSIEIKDGAIFEGVCRMIE